MVCIIPALIPMQLTPNDGYIVQPNSAVAVVESIKISAERSKKKSIGYTNRLTCHTNTDPSICYNVFFFLSLCLH